VQARFQGSLSKNERKDVKYAIFKSLQFVRGVSEKKIAMDKGSGASALIIHLEDSVSPDRTESALKMVRKFLQANKGLSRQQRQVHLLHTNAPRALTALLAIAAGTPYGIKLPKIESSQDKVLLDHYLRAVERHEGATIGRERTIIMVNKTPAEMFELKTNKVASPQLLAFKWDTEHLSSPFCPSTTRFESGVIEFVHQLSRSYASSMRGPQGCSRSKPFPPIYAIRRCSRVRSKPRATLPSRARC